MKPQQKEGVGEEEENYYIYLFLLPSPGHYHYHSGIRCTTLERDIAQADQWKCRCTSTRLQKLIGLFLARGRLPFQILLLQAPLPALSPVSFGSSTLSGLLSPVLFLVLLAPAPLTFPIILVGSGCSSI